MKRSLVIFLFLTSVSTLAAEFERKESLADIISRNVPPEMLKIRDPFKKPSVAKGNMRPRTELEEFDTTKFQMIGVVTGPDRLRAMLSAPNGKTYFVKESDRIGLKDGVIKRITAEKIVVHEKVQNMLGQEETLKVEISLPPEQ